MAKRWQRAAIGVNFRSREAEHFDRRVLERFSWQGTCRGEGLTERKGAYFRDTAFF